MHAPLRVLIPAVGAAIAVALVQYFANLPTPPPHLFSVAVSALVGGVFVMLAELLIFELPLRNRVLRRLVDRRSQLEGLWLQQLDDVPERPMSLATIEYDPKKKLYIYKGVCYDAEKQRRARWWSEYTVIEPGAGRMKFFGEGQVYPSSVEYVRHWGEIIFDRQGSVFSSKFIKGQGSFIDIEQEARLIKFRLDRVTRKMLRACIGKSRIENNEDEAEFLSAQIKLMQAESDDTPAR